MDYQIRYTGHPFVDVGVATLVAYAKVNAPEELTAHHLQIFEEYAKPIYLTKMMLGYMGYVVFPNIVNTALTGEKDWEKYAEKRESIIGGLFALWRWDGKSLYPAPNETMCTNNEVCIFCGHLGVVQTSQRLIPMIGGSASINFFPEGNPRMALCRSCTISMLAMFMGILNSGGKAFMVHSHDRDVLQRLIDTYLSYNIRDFALPNLTKRPSHKHPRTQLIENLMEAGLHAQRTSSITAYLFTAGSKNAGIEIYHLPSGVLDFIRRVSRADSSAWEKITSRAWELQKVGKAQPLGNEDNFEEDNKIEYGRRNFLYEDLFNLPQEAVRFLRTYLMRYKPRGKANTTDPRYTYSFMKEREVLSWSLISLFMEKVMNMEKSRIDAIRKMGERLARYIQEIDARFYTRLYMAKGESGIRSVLIRASHYAKSQNALGETLLPFDEFVEVFFFADDMNNMRPDWYLAYDLLLIRIMECLSPQWVQSNQEQLNELAEENNIEKAV